MGGRVTEIHPNISSHRNLGGDAGSARVQHLRLHRFPRQDAGQRLGLILPHWIQKCFWFAVLYAAGVTTIAVVAYGIRALLRMLR